MFLEIEIVKDLKASALPQKQLENTILMLDKTDQNLIKLDFRITMKR